MYIHSLDLQKVTSKQAMILLLDAFQLYSHNMNFKCRRQSHLKLKLSWIIYLLQAQLINSVIIWRINYLIAYSITYFITRLIT